MEINILKRSINDAYSSIARKKTIETLFSCCGQSNYSDIIAKEIGYTSQEINSVPKGSNQGLGCGNPISELNIKKGNYVVDLGSGAGFDAFLAANLVGESGKIIGIDFSEEMINKARVNAYSRNYNNVEFKLGEIENLPVESNQVDAVISNCVINLSQDKEAVFNEAFRVLKKNGKLLISDILLHEELPDKIKNLLPAHIACVSGAVKKEKYIALMRKCGFEEIEILSEQAFPLELILKDPVFNQIVKDSNISDELIKNAVKLAVSVKFSAIKKRDYV